MYDTGDGFVCSSGEEIQGHYAWPGWYFWDEVGLLGGGPYSTKDEARRKLNEYCLNALGSVLDRFKQSRIDWVNEGF